MFIVLRFKVVLKVSARVSYIAPQVTGLSDKRGHTLTVALVVTIICVKVNITRHASVPVTPTYNVRRGFSCEELYTLTRQPTETNNRVSQA